jgi:hypothetical protein
MADKATKTLLSDIVAAATKNAAVVSEIQTENHMIMELVNTIYQRVEDMSKKFDEVLNTGLKKPKITVTKKVVPDTETTVVPKKKKVVVKKNNESKSTDCKLIKNIMTYFKVKYTDDQNFFDSILEENQAAAIFEEHKDELNDKTGPAKIKTQSSLLYKNLTKVQKKKIREKMMDENDAANVNNDDDIEEEKSD